VALAVPEVIRATAAGQMPEATYPPVSDAGIFGAKSARLLVEQAATAKGLLIGPGIGPATDFVRTLLGSDKDMSLPPMVVDADGLNVLAQMSNWWQLLPARTILTPHPGEMARLMGLPLAEVKKVDRVELARDRARAWGHVVLLKGAYTVVADPDGYCTILPFANPLLAVGGSGDVLSGIIVGLLAQGLKPYGAAVLGGYIHGAAGELAAETFGDAGMLAGELAERIPQVRRRLLADKASGKIDSGLMV
jgi:NAD(P)H-hydrate epimerase